MSSTAAVKVIGMAIAGVAGMVTSRLIIQNYGIDAYAQYGMLATLPSLIPFADLGVAAVLVNVIAESRNPRRDPRVTRTITSAFRILFVSATVLALGSIACGLFGWWPALLGDGLMPQGGALAATLCGLVFALALPLGVGQRLLVSAGRTALQTGFSALGSPLVLLLVAASVALMLPMGPYVAVFSYLASAVVAVVCLVTASRLLHPIVGDGLRDVPRLRSAPGVRVVDVAWPMLLQMMALPVAMQTGRLMLSHLATPDDIAQYNLASQLFGLVVQSVAAGGMALWPLYARARADGRVRSPLPASLVFLGVATAAAGLLWLLLEWMTQLISDGEIQIGPALAGGFVVFVALQAVKYPLGMYMTDARGLRFQVLPIIAMVPIGLGLSALLIPHLGAAGPVWATSAAVLVCQVLPNAWYVRGDLARRAAQDGSRG